MTTTVKIEAHLSREKEVVVEVNEDGAVIERITLQDGERAERYVYDNREISVREVAKNQNAN